MAPPSSPEERITALRTLVNGKRQPAGGSNYRNESYLLGVGLHAIVRKNKGQSLTSIEKVLYDAITTGSGTSEINEYGNVFKEAKENHRTGGVAFFPQQIVDASEDKAYTMEAMVSDIVTMLPDIQDQPNNKVQEFNNFLGGRVDSDDYTAALGMAGGGTAVHFDTSNPSNMTAPRAAFASDDTLVAPNEALALSENRVEPAANGTKRIRLVMTRFKCHKRSSEWGKDEIYWTRSAVSDTGDKFSGDPITREYGSIRSGDLRQMDAGTVLFDGQVQDALAIFIQCWEADNSSTKWYEDLRKAMDAISKGFKAWLEQYGQVIAEFQKQLPIVGNAYKILGYISTATQIFAWLLDKFRNHDDLVAERTIAFSQQALTWFLEFPNCEASFMFDGGKGGKHELWIRREYGFDPNDTSIGSLKTMTGYPGNYSIQSSVPGPGRSFWGMSLVDYKGELWSFFSRSHNSLLCYSIWNSETGWGAMIEITGNYTNAKPAVATLDDTVHVLYKGGDGRLLHVEYLPKNRTWTRAVPVGSGTATAYSGALAGFDDMLVSVHRGNDQRLYCTVKWSGQNWQDWTKMYSPAGADYKLAPALCSHGGTLYVWACINRNYQLHCYRVNMDTNPWTLVDERLTDTAAHNAKSAPAVMVYPEYSYGDVMWAFYRYDSVNATMFYDPKSREEGLFTPGNPKSVGDPSVCNYDGKVWYGYSDRLS
ncbi:hypothetical protein BDV41DRAFT_561238 [Aspergillus transmontanensis]|uniref:Fucose-specific lectin n=1 Tax=Aspergillus transmontanensis TaxID=1034304 RepID=A0A5N6WA84_9EURO|nr:hypothetical protein BDV41DRAFT_561238 [Aspergillus transmontanensis]